MAGGGGDPECFAPTDEFCVDVPIHRIMICVFVGPCFFFVLYLELYRSKQRHFRLVRAFAFASMIAQAIHAIVLPLGDPWANSFTQSLAGVLSGFANVQWVNNMIKAESVISQTDVPKWLTPYTIGLFAVNAITFPIGEFGTHFSQGCEFLEFQEVMFIFIIVLTTLPIDVATFFVYKKARKIVINIEDARSRIQIEQSKHVDLERSQASKTKDQSPIKHKKRSSGGSDEKYKVANDGKGKNTLAVGGSGGVKEAWNAKDEPSVSRNAPSKSAISKMSRTASRFLSVRKPSRSGMKSQTDDMDTGLRIHKAGLRKIRHMMFSFNAVMITFAALTIWELSTHALEKQRDPCKFDSLIGHRLYYSIWYLFQLWHTNTAQQQH